LSNTFYTPLLLVMLGAMAWLAAITRKFLFNTVTIICGMWFVSVFFASLGLFGIRPYSERALAMIAIGCVGIAMGDLLIRLISQHVYGMDKKQSSLGGNSAYSLNMRALLCFQIFCTVYYALMCAKSFQLLRAGRTFADLRTIYQGYAYTETTLSNFEQAIGNHIAKSFIFIIIPTALIVLFTRREVRYRKTVLILTVLDLCMYTFYTASRMVVMVAVSNALVLMVLYKAHIPKKVLKRMKKMGIVCCIAVVVVTALRATSQSLLGVWETVYAYFSAPLPLMSLWIEKIDASIRPTKGLAFLNGLLSAFDILFKRFNIVIEAHQESSSFISSFETFIPVYGGKKINAFVSAFSYFYLDGREAGVFFFGGVMGMIGGYFEERVQKRPDLLSVLTYILLLQAVVKFLFKWEFASSSYVLAFVYLRLVFVRRRRFVLARVKRNIME